MTKRMGWGDLILLSIAVFSQLSDFSMKQAGFAVPHSSLTIGWVGVGTLGWGWVGVGVEVGLGLGWGWVGVKVFVRKKNLGPEKI